MGQTSTELLETFLRLGYISQDTVKALAKNLPIRGIPPLEAGLISGDLHPDAKGWVLAGALGLPYLEVDPGAVSLDLADVLPESLAREHMLVPVSREEDRLTLAVADPFGGSVFAAVEKLTGLSIRLAVCPRRVIAEILDRFYPDAFKLSPGETAGGAVSREEAEEWMARGRAVRLAEEILLRAAGAGATSLRVFPSGRRVLVAGQGAGEPVLFLAMPLRHRRALIAAFRDLAERSAGTTPAPAGTVFHLESEAGVIAFRAHFLRGISGPEVVVKALPERQASIGMDSLGMSPEQAGISRKVLLQGNGFFLFSSAGDEGVASTLFAMLREIASPARRVLTVEEQFRFRTERYIQIERREAARLSGGRWERLAESLDPDVLMIDRVEGRQELSDLVHLAQAGVAVLCGMRALDFERALQALLSADVDPFILSRVGRLVVHQRLVKLLCLDCRRPVPARPSVRTAGERHRPGLEAIVAEASFFIPGGCPRCRETGYRGKMALFDLLPFTPAVQGMVASRSWLTEKFDALVGHDFQSAAQPVKELLRRGMVTYDDVLPFFR